MAAEHYNIILLRGKFIDLTVDIETIMDDVLANHFCSPKIQNDFKQYILDETMFNRKIELFKKILKANYPALYKKYESHIDFKKLKDVRNRFAHNKISYHTKKNGTKDLTKLMFGDPSIGINVLEIKDFENKFEFFKEQLKVLTKILSKIIDR